VNSRTTARFWKCFERLPSRIQRQAHKTYRLWQTDPGAPSLHFKRVDEVEPLYAVRIGRGYRALGLLEGDTIYWIWIGDHDEYDRILG